MNTQHSALWGSHPPRHWIAALSGLILWYLLAQTATKWLFQVTPAPSAYAPDLVAHLLIGVLLFGMSRSLARFLMATAALFSVLTLANALKLATLGAPIMPDDFAAARNMFLLLDGWQLAGAILMVALPSSLIVWMIDWRRPHGWTYLAILGLVISLVALYPTSIMRVMDKAFGHSVWNQPQNYQRRGLPIHLLQETARSLARRADPPSQTEVDTALEILGASANADFVKVAATSETGRNLHMIVLESFWDPMRLTASRLSADPIAPSFRTLWAASGHSHLLAPVFGGYTANTEFEILCGFPINQDNVYFEFGLRQDVPCLPRQLRGTGYHTIASHPNAASFWNRVNAYRRIGFETYWADRDFLLDDMNRSFLSDASLYRQVMERLDPALRARTPLFNYVLTYFGHLPYPLNERRPAVIEAAPGHQVVADYANSIYYKSRELMAFLDDLRARDPHGLIVILGDHLPALNPNFGGYTESGLLARQRGEFSDQMFRTLVETPLILIDGQRGPLAVGDLPAYRLPGLLLELLGDQRPNIMNLLSRAADQPRIRPLPGMHLALERDRLVVCRHREDDPAECQESSNWVKAAETLRTDLFQGKQHALMGLMASGSIFREAAVSTPQSGLRH